MKDAAKSLLISLSNWFFVRLYKNKRIFSNYSLLANIAFTLCGFIFSCFHYELFGVLGETTKNMHFSDILGILTAGFGMFGLLTGLFMTVIFCFISKAGSSKYAQMLGKE